MRTAILIGMFLLALPLAAPAAESDLYGTWRLIGVNRMVTDTGEVTHPRGKAPTGYLSLGPDGRMMLIILNEKRPQPESLDKITDQQRIDLFKTMSAYAGTYKLVGNKLNYRYDTAYNEVQDDGSSTREIRVSGDRLTMINAPARNPADGKYSVTTLVWEKVQAPARGKK